MQASGFRRKLSLNRLQLALCGLLVTSFVAFGLRWHAPLPRVWAAREVPVAFWAWRGAAPAEAEVASAVARTHTHTLFLRAGQLHDDGQTFRRARAVTGRLPRGIELHLVYNSTPTVLAEFESLDAGRFASAIVEAYAQDLERASRDGAQVVGLQLDIDAPTRLLSHYARILRVVRERLPRETRLSVTGLPTWMESPALKELLAAVDFWIPQCYGALIPERLEQRLAISSPQSVARAINRARALDKPFYAGLAAYGYALLYDARGALVSLRGDMNPARIAVADGLQLIERTPFESPVQMTEASGQTVAGEWRYVYRASGDSVIDGLIIHAGDTLVLDLPSAATVRESARAVRQLAGEKLLGLCIFRLPGEDDPSTLPVKQVANALSDAEPVSAIELEAKRAGASPVDDGRADDDEQAFESVRLTATNDGGTSALLGMDGMTIDLRVPAGSVRAVRSEDFSAVETFCASDEQRADGEQALLQPCAARRANVIRLHSSNWLAGARAGAVIRFTGIPPEQLAARVRMHLDDGRSWQQDLQIRIGDER